MTEEEKAAQAAKTRVRFMEGLARAERALFTRPAPKSPNTQMRYLRKRERGSTKRLAERLGVSRKTVQRYLSGASTKPNKRLQAALVQETESEWQPQVKAQAREHASTSGGLVIKFRATLGFTANGSSDDGRVRDLSIAVSPSHAALILAAQEEGATDTDLHEAIAEAVADAYFRQGGGGRASLKVNFTDVESLNIEF
ncbi:telomere-protecting terminal protein Tpg [Streptomyces antarcticus]|uniref:telomere-protecting terminal protein Tpg n=1 Tax=Streptomyces antarcticus TaxID=2996458 RepID=UPI00226E0548|nr:MULTISPECIES: helix-turn-helix domain-containing protein [unclassified Streptomyces]MCY0947804.1 helix-turn-helix domain-containing protein [Streptomyces sp. H34-AA3]MCZ4088339.1 helix-turn-helix domain-containing protein [Streptomyces sp. H34-S5]